MPAHEHSHNRAQIFISMTVVLLKIIPLILQDIERLVLYSPPGTPST